MSERVASCGVGRGRRARERGFALPMVILISLVAVVLVAAMLGRQSTQGLAVARQVEAVRDWHFSRGVREIVDAWMRSRVTGSFRELLAADGRAFDLSMEDGTQLSLFLVDEQGTLLTDTGGLTADEVIDLRGALEALGQEVPASRLVSMTRRVGPSSVSLWTATPEVIGAVCRQIAGSEGADECKRTLLDLREKKQRLGMGDIQDAGASAGLNEKHRAALGRMITSEPTLYRFVLDVKASEGAASVARYTGHLVARSTLTRGAGLRTGAAPARSSFLSWEKVQPR